MRGYFLTPSPSGLLVVANRIPPPSLWLPPSALVPPPPAAASEMIFEHSKLIVHAVTTPGPHLGRTPHHAEAGEMLRIALDNPSDRKYDDWPFDREHEIRLKGSFPIEEVDEEVLAAFFGGGGYARRNLGAWEGDWAGKTLDEIRSLPETPEP